MALDALGAATSRKGSVQAMAITDDPNDPDLKVIEPSGMQKTYLVLSEEERAKGFVRPLRRAYKHVGTPGPRYPLRKLTDEEKEKYGDYQYVAYEEYLENDGLVVGQFWTARRLANAGKGCHGVTIMGQALAETYARNPHFYGATFCVVCGEHLPVGLEGEFVWDGTDVRVGT